MSVMAWVDCDLHARLHIIIALIASGNVVRRHAGTVCHAMTSFSLCTPRVGYTQKL